MFEKFGELGSAEEINELAENLFNEQDEESLEAMEKEMQMRGIENTKGLNIPLGVSREGV